MKKFLSTIFMLALFSLAITLQAQLKPTNPTDYFGFKPGTDRMLFNYEKMIGYFSKLDNESNMIKLIEIGKTPMNKPMYIVFISSKENIANLDRLKYINTQLAINPNIKESDREKLIEEGRVFFLGTLSMHSGEVGPTQAAPQIAYNFITSEDKEVQQWLTNVVYMMVPNHNPDGMDMVVEHYNKTKGTKYEGSSLPRVYHKYVGHDNNRDFVALTQSDTKAIAKVYNTDWYPQVFIEKHQMGSRGPRYFVPPNHDPIAENIDEGIWNWTGIFGSNMIKDMTAAGLAGVTQHYVFDDYWPGSTETCIWKNVIGFLSECASANYATPVFVEPTELSVGGKGLSEYKKSINMPLPWKGGKWGLEEITQYEIVSTNSMIKTASTHKKDILTFRNDLCKKQVQMGMTEPPYYYVLPMKQHDYSEFVSLVNLMIEHGVSVFQLSSDVNFNSTLFATGDIVIPLAQPYRAFIKEVMESQKYPLRHYTPGGEIIKPYDITSWSLPLHKGVKSVEIEERSKSLEYALTKIEGKYELKVDKPSEVKGLIFNANNNESYYAAFTALSKGKEVYRTNESIEYNKMIIPAGSFLIYEDISKIVKGLNVSPIYFSEEIKVKATELKMPKIGLVETIYHDMDAGWTRYIFDTYNIKHNVINPADFKIKNGIDDFDIIVFPNSRKSILMQGKYKSGNEYYSSNYPPELAKGMEKEGLENLMKFIDRGGIVVSWGASTELFAGVQKIKHGKKEIEEFRLPFRDVSSALIKKGLYMPGTFVKINLLKDHPLTYGLEKEIGVFSRGQPVFGTSIPFFDMDRRVIGYFPDENILLSGYAEKQELLSNKAGLIWLKKGRGQLVLMGFSPQFRAETNVSYKLLFNSLLIKKH